MSHPNILITGASGYLGGNILAQWKEADLPSHGVAYALVRSDKHASDVKSQGFSPIRFDAFDATSVERNLVDNKISIVFWLIDALKSTAQPFFIDALAKVKDITGAEVHFIHTSGAKIFSSHAGAPSASFSDADPKLYEIQKNQHPKVAFLQQVGHLIADRGLLTGKAVDTNNLVIEKAEALGVRSYIFIPCIVYGQGQGLGNPVSIQTVAIIKAARALRKVCRIDQYRSSWPISHINDTASLYLEILRGILQGDNIGYGKNGYYLAASGSAVWDDLYSAMAASLHRRGVTDTADVSTATEDDLEKMGVALNCPKELVPVQLSGNCALTAEHGNSIGWQPKAGQGHVLEAADVEVAFVMEHI